MLQVYDTSGDSLPLNSEESGTDCGIIKEEDDDGDEIEVEALRPVAMLTKKHM